MLPLVRSPLAGGVVPTCARIALATLALVGCAEAGLRLPRLRVSGWLTVSAAAGRSVSAGAEVGLVMPLDADVAAGDGDLAPEEPDPLAVAAPDELLPEEVARVAVIGRAARCRVPAACRWESAERARVLARRENEGGRR